LLSLHHRLVKPHNALSGKHLNFVFYHRRYQMGALEDVRNWLKEIPLWQELNKVPDGVSALEKKLEELESKLGGKWPPDVCRLCGERAARLGHSHLEKMIEVFSVGLQCM